MILIAEVESRRMPYRGVVAAGHELTVRAAEIMFRTGGNAFDAILAAHLAACTAEPVLASLGGGGFMIAKPDGGEPVVYDFFVQTRPRKRPASELSFRPILANFGTAQQQFHIGQGTIATPGSVKGIFQIHRDLGSLPITEIAAPAIQYARDGVTLNPTQAYVFRITRPIFLATADECRKRARSFASRNWRAPSSDSRSKASKCLPRRDCSRHRRSVPRAGRTADAGRSGVLPDCQAPPLVAEYRGARVMTNPPPSSGGVLIAFALELLKASLPTAVEFGTFKGTFKPLLPSSA